MNIYIGDIIFVELMDFNGCVETHFDDHPGIDYHSFMYGDICYYHRDLITKEDRKILFALKYLGNGLVEEMATGEKFFIKKSSFTFVDETDLEYDDEELKDEEDDFVHDDICDFNLDVEDEYAVYLVNNERTMLEYVKDLKKAKVYAEKYPLIVDAEKSSNYIYTVDNSDYPGIGVICNMDICRSVAYSNGYEFDDLLENEPQIYEMVLDQLLKKEYLKTSDEKRKELIECVKKLAVEDAKLITEKIDEVLNKYKVNDELLDMAYFENQLYDFKNKGKSK